MQCDPLMCSTDDAENLPAVVAGVVVAFLLLTLLITGIIVGVALLRRANERENSLERNGELRKRECTEKQDKPPQNESALVNDSQEEIAFYYEQQVGDLHYESTDVLGQGRLGREEGNRIRFEGGHYNDDIDADVMKNGAGHKKNENTQQSDQPKGTSNVVYAVVDKSKKKRKEKTQGGASATTTQGVYTEEQHHESSSAFGQDWLGNVVGGKPEGNHGNVEQGSPSNDAKTTGPQSEPCNPNAVYALVDKSKKRNDE